MVTSFNYNGGAGAYPGGLTELRPLLPPSTVVQITSEVKMRYFSLGAEYSRQKFQEQFQELDNYCRPQLRSEGLSEDYLLIPQATIVESNIRATYFCGSSIQGTNPGPPVLVFNSGGNYKAEQEVGLASSYKIV